MKSILSIIMLGLALTATAKNEVYQTANDGSVTSFEDLAKIEGSGVTKEGDNTYVIVKDIEVLANDGITLANNTTLKLAKDVIIKMFGKNFNFAPADTALITNTEEGVKPKGLWFTETDGYINVKHIRFEYAGVRIAGPAGAIIENCTFFEHNASMDKSAISINGSSVGTEIRKCTFIRSARAAIATGSNIAAGKIIEDCVFEQCCTDNRNYPVINEVPSGNNGEVIIRRNKIYGGKFNMSGAISVSNMLGVIGANKVLIEDNYMDNCRYGMNLWGQMVDFRVINNTIINCHYETNANNGGSGIAINCANKEPEKASKLYIEGNTIEGCLWGITNMGNASPNIGKVDDVFADDYNPGNNVFRNNGNCEKAPAGAENAFDPSIPYDLYNHTPMTVYAQGNLWGGADQSAAEIAKRIVDAADDSAFGEVIYLPAADPAAIQQISADSDISVDVIGNGSFSINGVADHAAVQVYDIAGKLLFNGSANGTISVGTKGLVIIVVDGQAYRILL